MIEIKFQKIFFIRLFYLYKFSSSIMLRALLVLILIFLSTNSKLYQVFSLCRHGARYHERDLWDGNDTKPMWFEIHGGGMRQHQKLGQIIRKQYIQGLGFLSENYNKSEIEGYTTFTNRTAGSLNSQFYGLYPPGTGPRLSPVDRKWHLPPYTNKTNINEQNYPFPNGHQPVPFRQTQKILLRSCPNYKTYFKQNCKRMAQDIDQLRFTYGPFMRRVADLFNFTLNDTNLEQMFYAYDACIVDSHLGRPWPVGFTKDDFKNLQHLATWHYTTMWSGNNTIMSSSGKINKMLNLFDLRTKVPNNEGVKWSFLAGHEGDMLATQLALNITSSTCIEEMYRKGQTSAWACELEGLDFASNIIIELHSDDAKNFYVKIRSNGNYMKLSQNSYQIPFLDFKTNMKKFVTNDLQTFCGRPLIEKQRKSISKQPELLFI